MRKQLLLNFSHSAPVQTQLLSKTEFPLMDKPGFELGFSLNLRVCLFLNWTSFPAAESPTSKKDVRALKSPSSPNHSSTPCRQEHAESRNVLPLQKGKTRCVCLCKEPIPTWGTDRIPQRSAPAFLGFELSFSKPGLPCELPLGCRPRELILCRAIPNTELFLPGTLTLEGVVRRGHKFPPFSPSHPHCRVTTPSGWVQTSGLHPGESQMHLKFLSELVQAQVGPGAAQPALPALLCHSSLGWLLFLQPLLLLLFNPPHCPDF